MNATRKTTIFRFLLTALAAPLWAQGTHTAASCNRNDVNAVINGPTHTAVNGDTISIPAGSCTWTTGITVPTGVGISIIGAGTPNSTAGTRGASASCSATVITDDQSSGAMFSMTPTYGSPTSRISCMKLLPATPRPGFGSPLQIVGTCTSSGCPSVRVDNITAPSSWGGIGISDDTFVIMGNMFGVADHNTIGDVAPSGGNGVDFINVSHGSWQGVGQYGDNSWASAGTFGTAQAFYLENNVFNYAFGTDTDTGGANGGGGRWVCRYNTFNSVSTGTACGNHGTDTTGRPRGGRQQEFYNNTGTCTNPSQGCPALVGFRSATGIIFGNSMSNSGGGFSKSVAAIDTQRRWRPDSPWGPCDGSSPWDVNDGTVYYSGTIGSVATPSGNYTITDSGSPGWTANRWKVNGTPYSVHDVTVNGGLEIGSNTSNTITAFSSGIGSPGATTPAGGHTYQILRATACIDQPGRGAGLLVTGTTPTLVKTGSPGSVAQVLDPIYEFQDSGPFSYNIGSDSQLVIANRDFYTESVNQAAQTSPTSPFNGTSGTGHGTLTNRPTACTPGVGYWATDQGNWNQSGSGGQGELFVCTAPNTWTFHYMPYTYPHPVIQGSGSGSGSSNPPPAAPTNVAATVQ